MRLNQRQGGQENGQMRSFVIKLILSRLTRGYNGALTLAQLLMC